MEKKKPYRIPAFQMIPVADVIRTSNPQRPLKTSENGFGDEVDF